MLLLLYMPMKQDRKSRGKSSNNQQDKSFRKKTDMPGQNPKVNDDPSHSLYHDENRKR